MSPHLLSEQELLREADGSSDPLVRALTNMYVNGDGTWEERCLWAEGAADDAESDARKVRAALELLLDALGAHFGEDELPKAVADAMDAAENV